MDNTRADNLTGGESCPASFEIRPSSGFRPGYSVLGLTSPMSPNRVSPLFFIPPHGEHEPEPGRHAHHEYNRTNADDCDSRYRTVTAAFADGPCR